MPNFYDQRAFCDENFLSHGDLRTIEKLRTSLIQSLDKAGVLSLAAGGNRLELQKNRDGLPVLPHFLNSNGGNLPLLAALISCAVAPGFAVRKGPSLLRTPQDTVHTYAGRVGIKADLPYITIVRNATCLFDSDYNQEKASQHQWICERGMLRIAS